MEGCAFLLGHTGKCLGRFRPIPSRQEVPSDHPLTPPRTGEGTMRIEAMTDPTKGMSDAMRAVLSKIEEHPDARLVHNFRNGWVLRRTLDPGGPRAWPRYEWIDHPKTLTVEALIRRGLLEVKVPRTTPGLTDVTAFLTDAGRAAVSPATVPA